ncbi:hypothetical protein L915_20377, partial [Phytophthora nicotianae]
AHEGIESRWIRAHQALSELKNKIATTPMLRHFDPDRQSTVVM